MKVRYEKVTLASTVLKRYDAWESGQLLGRVGKDRSERCHDQWSFWSNRLGRRFYGATRTEAIEKGVAAGASYVRAHELPCGHTVQILKTWSGPVWCSAHQRYTGNAEAVA